MTITVARNGEALADYDEVNFQAAIRSREVLATDYYWTEGMPDWATVDTYGGQAVPGPLAPSELTARTTLMARTVKMQPEDLAPQSSGAPRSGSGALTAVSAVFRRLFQKK